MFHQNISQISEKITNLTQNFNGVVVVMMMGKFKFRGDLLIWIIAGQRPTVRTVGAGGDYSDIFSLPYHFSFLSPSLGKTARYRLNYSLKGPLNQNN